MKRSVAILLALALALLAAPCALAGEEELTFLFTTDIHSNLVPRQELIDGRGARVGGFARLKSAIAASYVEGETLLMDSGDFSMGTLYQAFTGTEALELQLMGELGYDAIALGNHDFELTVDGLREELAIFRDSGGQSALLCSNLVSAAGEKAATDGGSNPLSDVGVRGYTVIERNGLRVGVFSLMGKEAIQYTPSSPLAFADQVETAKACVKALREREKVDIVVMLSHCGILPDGSFHEDADIAKAVDGIDVILSGHMHVPLSEPVLSGGAVIVCAGSGLSHLGKLKMRREDGKWMIDEYELIPLDESWTEDTAVANEIAAYTERIEADYMARYGVDTPLNDVVATSPYDFSNAALYAECAPHAFGALMADAYLEALREAGLGDVWIAGVPTGTVRAGLYKGDMTLMDVYNVLSYGISPLDGSSGAPIVTACLTGSDLYDLCEASVSLSGFIDSVQILFSGLRYTYSLQRPILDRVYKVEALNPDTGEYEIVERSDDRLYKTAFSWTSAQSLGLIGGNSYGLLNLTLRDESGAPLDTDEKLLERIVYQPASDDGQKREFKEWYALYTYITSFPKNADGLPEIPTTYGHDADYMVKTNVNIATFFVNPSKPALVMLAAALALLALIAIPTILVRTRRKRRARTK